MKEANSDALERVLRSALFTKAERQSRFLRHVVEKHLAGDDASLRPNQLLAFSLPDAPLEGGQYVEAIAPALLTSLGLRSLAPGSPDYRGLHRGDSAGRDRAYHQGTVWPWLIGPYVEAADRAGLPLAGILSGLELHLAEWGLGSVSETTDGDSPHRGTGCPFQAWSVAELLRAGRIAMKRLGS